MNEVMSWPSFVAAGHDTDEVEPRERWKWARKMTNNKKRRTKKEEQRKKKRGQTATQTAHTHSQTLCGIGHGCHAWFTEQNAYVHEANTDYIRWAYDLQDRFLFLVTYGEWIQTGTYTLIIICVANSIPSMGPVKWTPHVFKGHLDLNEFFAFLVVFPFLVRLIQKVTGLRPWNGARTLHTRPCWPGWDYPNDHRFLSVKRQSHFCLLLFLFENHNLVYVFGYHVYIYICLCIDSSIMRSCIAFCRKEPRCFVSDWVGADTACMGCTSYVPKLSRLWVNEETIA